MVDGDSKPFSIERCRELLGTEDSGLSDEEIEPLNLRFCMRLGELGNLVAQIGPDWPRWNRLAVWLREAERFSAAA